MDFLHQENKNKILGIWYMVGVGMLLGQILLGGITRLTGSGLSITEWKAILGFIPPMNEQAWNLAFIKYQQFGQFKLVNTSMTLEQFKHIYFWEWFHRLWGRLIGIAALIPLIFFAIKKLVDKQDIFKIVIAIVLGGVAGIVGWIMVQSGLKQNTVLVNPVNLMSHIVVATIIVAYVLYIGLGYLYPNRDKNDNKNKRIYFLLLILLVFIQIALGALVAGSKAALICTTFPDMNGQLYPAEINFANTDVYEYSTKLLFQFLHRTNAYLIFIWVIILFFMTKKWNNLFEFQRTRWLLLIMVGIQLLLGIFTLLNSQGSIPVVLGVLHQLGAFLLLIFSIEGFYFISYKGKEQKVV